MRCHNKGPIGPLDPDAPPPHDPGLKRHEIVDATEAILALRSMGCEVTEADLEYSLARNAGPPFRAPLGEKSFTWGDILDWAGRTTPVPELNRKEAAEFLRGLGCQVTETTLENLRPLRDPDDGEFVIAANRSPPFQVRGRRAFYTEEDLRKWAEVRMASNIPPPSYHAPKRYKPRNVERRCPPRYDLCMTVKHERCEKYPRAQCHFTHLRYKWNAPRLIEMPWTEDWKTRWLEFEPEYWLRLADERSKLADEATDAREKEILLGSVSHYKFRAALIREVEAKLKPKAKPNAD
jgi:hypothetical protein